MLKVVQYKQQMLGAQMIQKLIRQRFAAGQCEACGIGNGGREKLRGSDGLQRNIDDAIGVGFRPFSHRQGEPGLADTARAHEREQMAVGILQHAAEFINLPVAANERRGLPGKVRESVLLHNRVEYMESLSAHEIVPGERQSVNRE